MSVPLPILNLTAARYECTYGRGCDGVCCREGRPLIYPEEIEKIDAILHRVLPMLRPEARAFIQSRGYLTQRRRLGQPMARHTHGWCVFFKEGCVLHKLGAAEGDKFRYKPAVCALFPIQQDEHDHWYVRQMAYKGEKWDLFCLDPASTTVPAFESLREEIALAQRFDQEARGLLIPPGTFGA
jgi:hypothetical protein